MYMSARSQGLKETLGRHISDTLSIISIIEAFFETKEKWFLQRKREVDMMNAIKDRPKKILSTVTADNRRKQLERELGAVLKNTLEGLEELQHFLDAVEKLAATSALIFTDQYYTLWAVDIRSVILAARMTARLLINFKRDDTAFFRPSLSIIPVLILQLEKYIHISQQICEMLEESIKNISTVRSYREENIDIAIKLVDRNQEMSEMLLDHLNQLNLIRNNKDLRLTLIFQENALTFIDLFSQRKAKMRQFLSDMEESAKKLDDMKFGAGISNVAGSTVGVAGGVMSIIGIALVPLSAGTSLALTAAGLGLGLTSSVNNLVTYGAESAVNTSHWSNAVTFLQSFFNFAKPFIDCLDSVVSGLGPADSFVQSLKADCKRGAIDGFGIGKAAAGLEEVAKKLPVIFSKMAIVGNAVSIGFNVVSICKESQSLARTHNNEKSQFIYSMVTLWRSELDTWERIHDSLSREIGSWEESQGILKKPFYPVTPSTYVYPNLRNEKKRKKHRRRCNLL